MTGKSRLLRWWNNPTVKFLTISVTQFLRPLLVYSWISIWLVTKPAFCEASIFIHETFAILESAMQSPWLLQSGNSQAMALGRVGEFSHWPAEADYVQLGVEGVYFENLNTQHPWPVSRLHKIQRMGTHAKYLSEKGLSRAAQNEIWGYSHSLKWIHEFKRSQHK
jgi:hypothetical protein